MEVAEFAQQFAAIRTEVERVLVGQQEVVTGSLREDDLSRSHQVSWTTVREALKAQAVGCVEGNLFRSSENTCDWRDALGPGEINEAALTKPDHRQ